MAEPKVQPETTEEEVEGQEPDPDQEEAEGHGARGIEHIATLQPAGRESPDGRQRSEGEQADCDGSWPKRAVPANPRSSSGSHRTARSLSPPGCPWH